MGFRLDFTFQGGPLYSVHGHLDFSRALSTNFGENRRMVCEWSDQSFERVLFHVFNFSHFVFHHLKLVTGSQVIKMTRSPSNVQLEKYLPSGHAMPAWPLVFFFLISFWKMENINGKYSGLVELEFITYYFSVSKQTKSILITDPSGTMIVQTQ